MPKFNIEAEFGLETSIEPEGVRIEGGYDVENYEDNSYFGSESVEVSGGEVKFTVEAEDEDEAEEKAREVIEDGNEVEDHNGFTWLLVNVSINVEKVEEPMTLERAINLLKALFATLADGGSITEEQQEAFSFLLDFIAAQAVGNAAAQAAAQQA